ncbi:hypothetical protein EAH68_05325 [Corynebacterium hylobatis]|uniref:Uncharacterized protein n=1 Tax=Corynebacterium hylobatis TaxID=1859290 RepID=A0A430HZR9_9CORY|nr:hypothetical protein [Corynebacterium hylobatis]RSZ64415.1 hypothetical protein EAH68_05325 [Corynebacterium hylobatis]
MPKLNPDTTAHPVPQVKVLRSRRRTRNQYIALRPSSNVTITLSPAAAYRLADELVGAAETIERSGKK